MLTPKCKGELGCEVGNGEGAGVKVFCLLSSSLQNLLTSDVHMITEVISPGRGDDTDVSDGGSRKRKLELENIRG